MMRLKINIWAATLAISLYSCGFTNNGEGDDFVYKINIDNAEKIENPLMSDFCNEVETIILETADNSILSWIRKVIQVNDRLYILDMNRQANLVAEFDSDGKFIKRYGNVGRGPGEYTKIADFTVDENERRLYILEAVTNRVFSYDLDSGKYVEDIMFGGRVASSTSIVSVGDLLYADLNYREYDKSNYMLKSLKKSDPKAEKYYLPIGEHIAGWTNTRFVGNTQFIYRFGNEYSLVTNRYSNEIFKVTPEGVTNYIYLESKHFIDKNERTIISNMDDYTQTLWGFDCFYNIHDYFETDNYICFMVGRKNTSSIYLYDKNNGETKYVGYAVIDLIVKNGVEAAYSLFNILGADAEGILYQTPSRKIEGLRTAAREGMLVDGLDRLDELKELPEDSNPVLFYLKFKEPLQK